MLNIPNLEKMPWPDQRVYLRAFFIQGTVASASRKELEWFLIILANTNDQKHEEESENYKSTITQLLQVRINEELHGRTVLWAKVAVVISALAAAGTIWQAVSEK